MYIEGTKREDTVTVIKYRGNCYGGIKVNVKSNTLKITVHTCGCCDVIVKLPVKQYNITSDILASTLELKNLTVDRLILKAAAASVKISNLNISIANISAITSLLEANDIDISDKLSVYSSASTLKLTLLNRGALVTVRKSVASTISILCLTSKAPIIKITALASSVRITCMK